MIIETGVHETSNSGTVLLWTGDASSGHAAFSIPLDLAPYKVLYITLCHTKGSNTHTTLTILNDATMGSQVLYCVQDLTEMGREVSITSTGLSFTTGFKRSYSGGSVTFTGDQSDVAIPVRIYGRY